MKKRIFKILAFSLATLVLVGAAWVLNALVGNPISKALATRTAEQHLAQVYAAEDFLIERVSFNFKFGWYHAYIISPSSRDSSFTLVMDMGGKLLTDTYADQVVNGTNTATRIDTAYRTLVNSVLERPDFPCDTRIAFGEIVFVSEEYANDPSVPDYALISNDLTLDGIYDANALGATAGKLTIYAEDGTVTHERLAEILLDVKAFFDGAGVKFYAIDLVLEYPTAPDGDRPEGRVEVMELPYDQIYEDGMTDRVKASDQTAKEYYTAQDAQKQAEQPVD